MRLKTRFCGMPPYCGAREKRLSATRVGGRHVTLIDSTEAITKSHDSIASGNVCCANQPSPVLSLFQPF